MARLELEVDSSRGRAGASSLTQELRETKSTASQTLNELRGLSRGAQTLGTDMAAAGRGASTADKEIRRAGAGAQSAASSFNRLTRESRSTTAAFREGLGGVNRYIDGLSALRGAAIAVIGVGLAKEILDSADSVRSWNAQLKLAIPATTSLATAQTDVRRIAADTRSSIDGTTDLYAKFSRTSRDLGKSQAEASRATETFSETLKISGADTNEAFAVTRQFGQALASGTLRGDEFNSVMENSPRLARLLADSLGKNVGELRNMAQQGELTSDKLYAALTDKKFTAKIDEEFGQIPVTFGDAMVRVKDTATVTFAAFDSGGEFSQMLINFMLGGVGNMDTLEKRAGDLGIEIRSTLEGLGDVFEPMLMGGNGVFDALGIRIYSLREQIASMLGSLDQVANVGIGLKRADQWFDNGYKSLANKFIVGASGGEQHKTFGMTPLTEWSNMAGRFKQGSSDADARLSASRSERQLSAALPRSVATNGAELSDWLNGKGRFDPANQPKPFTPSASGGKPKHTGKSDEEKEAERLQKLGEKRKQDEADFWQTLRNQADTAKMLPSEAERYNEKLKLRKILNDGNVAGERELTKAQRERIDGLIQERETNAFTSGIRKDMLDVDRERMRLEDVAKTIAGSTLDTEEDNLAVQQKVWPYKLDALTRGLSLQDATVAKTIAEAEARERSNVELDKRNRLIDQGVDVAKEYGGPAYQQGLDRRDLEQKKVAAGEAVWANRITPETYQQTIKGLDRAIDQVDNRFRDQFIDSIDDVAGRFTGKFGSAVQSFSNILSITKAQAGGDFSKSGALGGIVGLFATRTGNVVADAAQRSSQSTLKQLMTGSTYSSPFKSLTSGFTDFRGDLRNLFGKGGDFQSGLGSVVGKATTGAAIGGATDSVLKALGVKSSRTGAQVGGALGSAVGGPIGGIIGSVGGGIIGGLFKKTSQGAAVLGNGSLSLSGSSSSTRSAANSLGQSVQQGIQGIADQLGAQLGGYTVSIGTYKGSYRVNPNGGTKLGGGGGKLGNVDFGADGEAAAIAYAIKDAIQDGALQGLSPTVQRIIAQAGTDLDKAVANAVKVKNVEDAYRQMTDPVNYALDDLNKSFEDLGSIMRGAGASAEELAHAQAVYEKQRTDIIAQANDSMVKDMQDYLFQLKGGTSSSLSPELRFATSKSQLDQLDATRAAGGTVAFDDYRSTADAFLAASRDAKGSGLDYFSDLNRVTSTLDAWISGTKGASITTPELNLAPVVSSIDAQTTAVTDLLTSIDAKLGSVGAGGGTDSGTAYYPQKYFESPRYLLDN